MRYFLQISYNGTAYHGWQIQQNAISIQAIFNEKLSLRLGTEIYCIGCGRTDTGVHARRFFLHFDFEGELPGDFIQRLNSFLPQDIVVQKAFLALDENAHSRWSALKRTYRYQACIGRNPLLMGYAAMLYKEVDLAAMNEAAHIITQHTGFEALSKVSPNEEHHLSTVFKAAWHQKGDMLIFNITANRFLRGMVRILVGTMLEVGYGKITTTDFENIIKSNDRKRAYAAAPAEGLYLWEVKYPEGMLQELAVGS